MKIIITLLLSCLTFTGFAKEHKTFDKLCEVNKCWTEQQDLNKLHYPAFSGQSEHEWIRIHLQLVEQTLRARNTAHLSATQKANRLAALGHLNEYWHSGNFPVNDRYSTRTPIFIDRHDNFCAVGYLVKATGHEQVSRMIAEKTNLAYVREMNYPELYAWAKDYGFTVDELAWIQPGYPPVTSVAKVGKGTNGQVHKLFVDAGDEKLFVGGTFTQVDGTIAANNIAYVTYDNGNYTWHGVGTGVNGPVKAIAEFDKNVFVAGSFTDAGGKAVNNIAYWDGTTWHSAGCISGTVNDLVVYKDELYAVGDFDVCASAADINFAKWSGTAWLPINGVSGHVNAAHAMSDHIILGGKFSYSSKNENIIKWDETNGFTTYTASIDNEVNDIHDFKNALYVGMSGDVDTTVVVRKLNTGTSNWDALKQPPLRGTNQVSVNTFCAVDGKLFAAGDLSYAPLIGIGVSNCLEVGDTMLSVGKSFGVDSAIYSMANFKGKFVAGGKFKKGYSGYFPVDINSIAAQGSGLSVETINTNEFEFNIYPNPLKKNSQLTVENDFNATQLTVMDMQGRVVAQYPLRPQARQQVDLKELPAAVYVAELSNDAGQHAVQRVSITE